MASVLLHGTIEAKICGAYKLETVGALSRMRSHGLYAAICLEKVIMGSRRIEDPTNPRWEECFYFHSAHTASNIMFTLHCRNPFPPRRDLIGKAYVHAEDILGGGEIEKWVAILDKDGQPIREGPCMLVKLKFSAAARQPHWARGIGGPEFPGVPHTFFSQQKGCKVSLYQDAHVPDDFAPGIPLAGGKTYRPPRCWKDMFDAITEAEHLIYIAGWSLYAEVFLLRDFERPSPDPRAYKTLGELLKEKADGGVKVVLLLWDELTSVSHLKYRGFMGTHDKETLQYFKGTRVHCVLCPRDNLRYTHHQKIVVVDSELPSGEPDKRRIVSFIGGFDLCGGRYDTQSHPLFGTLATEHRGDFHQPNFHGSAITKGGPREPWHDVHCRLEGPVAWDVYSTFVQRFKKQGGDGILVPEEEFENVIIDQSELTGPVDHGTWNVQLFRSIDDKATLWSPGPPEDVARVGLVRWEDKIIDRSIQDAYINAIRRAKNFIYIENQYFIGSSFDWSADGIKPENIDALSLIPKELSLKIVTKIKAKERFTVYVVIPMWPEGPPASRQVKLILDLQRRTMEMMYKDVVQALKEVKIEEDPRKYLAFFCLGNRELKADGEYKPSRRPGRHSDYRKAQEARRFMIYVHSKMMIVDDEYIIIGSANINQRSMDGGRDTEIAMGAYQPHHLDTEKEGARGQIHGFRMSLWYEHLGMCEDTLREVFLYPEREQCISMVNKLAEENWRWYSSNESLKADLPGHLLRYPIDISDDGTIKELRGFEYFPDTKARILGSKTLINKIFYFGFLGKSLLQTF